MKKIRLIAAAVVAAATSSAAMAQAYVQADLGMGHASSFCSGVTGASCSENAFAWGVTGGYVIGSGFSAELGYTDYGTAKLSAGSSSEKLNANAIKLGAAYALPFANVWSVDFRLGVASVTTKDDVNVPGYFVGSHSETKTKPYLGLGIGVNVQKNVMVHAGLEWTKGEIYGVEGNVRALSIGARYSF